MVALAADKGSPGVTTAALIIAAVWPRRAILAELDPFGGDVALRLRGPRGVPLSPETGLISLAVRARRGATSHQVFEHVQRLDGGLEVVVGLTAPEQATGLTGLWAPIAMLLHRVPDVDVVADCGRLYPGSPVLDVLPHAGAIVLVTRTSVESVAHVRSRAGALLADLGRRGVRPPPIFALVVTSPRDDRSAPEIERVMRQARLPVPVLGRLAYDPKGAGMLAGEWAGRLDKSLLVRSARDVAGRLAAATSGVGVA